MPELPDPSASTPISLPSSLPPSSLPPAALLLDRLRDTPGLATLVAEAEATWRARAGGDEPGQPGWRAFEDAFPTFYEFTNRPR